MHTSQEINGRKLNYDFTYTKEYCNNKLDIPCLQHLYLCLVCLDTISLPTDHTLGQAYTSILTY